MAGKRAADRLPIGEDFIWTYSRASVVQTVPGRQQSGLPSTLHDGQKPDNADEVL